MNPDILHQLLESVLALAATALAAALSHAAVALAKKCHIDISEKEDALLKSAAKDGILYAEEWAAKKFDAEGAAVRGEDKLVKATARLVAKVPGITSEEADSAIHAALPELGLGAAALSKLADKETVALSAQKPT